MTRLRRRLKAAAAAMALVAAACGGDETVTGAGEFIDQGAVVVVANSPGTMTTDGPQRVLVALLGDGPNQFLGAPDRPATIRFIPPGGGEAAQSTGTFLSTSGVALGLYVTTFDFDRPGQWEVTVTGGEREAAPAVIEVLDDSAVPGPGDPAPLSITPTATGADELGAITTDPRPEPDFYALSIDEAVANGRPTAIAFSTPAFCQTAICGPTLDMVKVVAATRPEIDFVHVEPFDIEQARGGSLVPIPAMAEWQLRTEPWVFVVDAGGRITAAFEGIIGQDELERALDDL